MWKGFDPLSFQAQFGSSGASPSLVVILTFHTAANTFLCIFHAGRDMLGDGM